MPEAKIQEQEEFQGGLTANFSPGQDIESPEPWEPWETKLVIYSLGIGIGVLIIGGILINKLLL
ncbi:hypothetical protein JOC37_001599 [Desulfohalotomaculum tongense]|uniref:hypothetical protein n=1 Tax=Desulforadius tongensis TaxID=1216062 RepID=UPI00195BDEB8|nr:hypothetical protein [Desulforadius tongensis]MBM7855214.1 hypothetical protein [Desulforadius tongensis]